MKKIALALFLFALDGLAMFLFKNFPGLFFPPYRNLSKAWTAFLASLTSPFSIALWDIAALVLAFLVLISLILTIIRRRSFLKWLSSIILLVSILAFLAVFGWMLNHYAPELSTELSLDVREYSYNELYETTEHYLEKASEYALLMKRDEEGHAVRNDFYEMAKIAGASYERLSEEYPVFKGTNARVKKLSLIGEYLMYNGIIGMYMPITAESGVPYSVPNAVLGFTMAHEAGHRLGLAGEEEANFAAFLACISSDDLRMNYSGYYNAFSYCFSALYKVNPEKALQLYESHDDEGARALKLDRKDTSEVYKRYESPLKEVSDQINDTYLKTFSEENGIQSYGQVTDYLIAWHFQKD